MARILKFRRHRRANRVAVVLGVALGISLFGLLVGQRDATSSPSSAVEAHGFSGADFRVIDGDTIQNWASGERIRISNIDAAETGDRARCSAERRHGEAAKSEARRLFSSARSVVVRNEGFDIYGRTLAHVMLDGHDFGETIIGENLARPWRGHREPWCGPGGSLLP